MMISNELIGYPQWVCFDENKVPHDAKTGGRASCKLPSTWADFRTAERACWRYGFAGVGFVFSESDPFCGIDLDDCFDVDGKLEEDAQRIVNTLRSFTEISVSGSGLHILVKAKLPGEARHPAGIGIFDRSRYFTMSGNHFPGASFKIEERQAEIEKLYAELFPQRPAYLWTPVAQHCSDERILERARQSEKFCKLYDEGDLAAHGNDWSAADLALVNLLCLYTGGNLQQVDRLFRKSSLMREKWDAPRSDSTYGAKTIERALERQGIFHVSSPSNGNLRVNVYHGAVFSALISSCRSKSIWLMKSEATTAN